MKLIIQPDAGITPICNAIKGARKQLGAQTGKSGYDGQWILQFPQRDTQGDRPP